MMERARHASPLCHLISYFIMLRDRPILDFLTCESCKALMPVFSDGTDAGCFLSLEKTR